MNTSARVVGTLIAATLALAGCGNGRNETPASQTAARVNKEEITVHQIDLVLRQQRGVRPEQTDALGRQVLERLIDESLAVQKAAELKLDREPQVQQQLDAARREIVARAYLQRVGDAATRPTKAEVEEYYAEHPALFKERRVYHIQELAIDAKPAQLDTLRARLKAAKTIDDFIAWLKASDYRFAGTQAVRAAEQLPLGSVETFAKMSDGQAVLQPTPAGAQVVVLAGSRRQPLALEQAAPAIEQFLLNERKRELVASDLKSLRQAAKVEYVGRYAEAVPAHSLPAVATSSIDPDTTAQEAAPK